MPMVRSIGGSEVTTGMLVPGSSYTVPINGMAKITMFSCVECTGWNGSWSSSSTLTLLQNGATVGSVGSSASVPERDSSVGCNASTITLEVHEGDVFTATISTYLGHGSGRVSFSIY